MFSQACVKNSVHGGEDVQPLGRHPLEDTPGQTPSWADPPGQTPPGRQLLQLTVRILLECILVYDNMLKNPQSYEKGIAIF